MAATLGSVIHKVRLQDTSHSSGPVAASANKPDAATREVFNCRDPNLRVEALGHDLALVEGDKEDAAHFLSPRLAAAIASRTLL